MKSNYYDDPAISNSALSRLNPAQGGSMKKYQYWLANKEEEKELVYLERGKLLHMSILEPDMYKVSDIERPSDSVCIIMEALAEALYSGEVDSKDEEVSKFVLAKAQEIGYGVKSKWKSDTILARVDDQGTEYLEFLMDVSQSGKLVITKEMKEKVDACYFALQQHPQAQEILFQRSDRATKESELYETLFGVKCRGKLDILEILGTSYPSASRHEEAIIDDLKTTSKPVSLFPHTFSYYHTYRQLAFYEMLVRAFSIRTSDKTLQTVRHRVTVVETNPPYEVDVFDVHPLWIEYGKLEAEQLLRYYLNKVAEKGTRSTILMEDGGVPAATSTLLKSVRGVPVIGSLT